MSISTVTFNLTIMPLDDTITVSESSQYTLTGNQDMGDDDSVTTDLTFNP